MKVLQVCQKFHPSVASGSTKVAYDISMELSNRGHSITVYTSDMKDSYSRIKNCEIEEINDVRVHRFRSIGTVAVKKMKIFVTPLIMSRVKKEIQNFDVIHLHEYRSFQNIIVAYHAKKYDIPYVLQVHGSFRETSTKQRLKWIYDALCGYRILSAASGVVALNNVEAEQYKRMGVPEDRIAVIPNGIDLSAYADLPPKGLFKRKFGIAGDRKVILYLGRIHETKGIAFLIRSYNHSIKKMGCKNTMLVIAGPDDGYLNEVQSLAHSLDISNSVVFTGLLSDKDKISAYVDANIVVNVEPVNVYGIVPLEAAACTTPVIVSSTNAISEVVLNGKFGFSVKYGDVNDLAGIMRKIFTNNDLLIDMGQKGRKFVFENYDWTNIIGKLENVYKEIIQSKQHHIAQ
ncbi:MAG: glycosyltransferase family 4 protein [Tenericutes bacterium]|nr:glycosyltransferase family 4 protein [Mycoplasmatota bacterium]